MVSLDVDVASNFLDGGEQVKPRGIHGWITRTEGEVLVNLLEPIEGAIKDGQASLDYGAVLEASNVASVDGVAEMAGFGTRTVAWHTLSIHSLFLWRTNSNAGSVILQ